MVDEGPGKDGARAGRLDARSGAAAAPEGCAVVGAGRAVTPGAVVVVAGACGAGRVTVPLMLKFCSSRGPMVSAGGEAASVLLPGGAVSWASADAETAASARAAAIAAMPKREPALISSRSLQ
jgi:hypothetical protein